MSIEVTSVSALSLILYCYQFQYSGYIEWDEGELKKLSRIFDLEKLLIIDQHIENYFAKKDIDLAVVLPDMEHSNSEKEILLRCISDGIKILAKKDLGI